MNSLARTIVGSAVTAAAVYFMDPVNGHQRRLMMQDRYKRVTRRLDLGTRDLRHDATERTRFAFGKKSDKAVNKLVCGAVRHSVSNPASVAVAVDHGHVFLRGNVLPHEHQRVLDEVRSQPGVIVITDHLTEQRGNGEYAVDGGRSFKVAARRSGWSTTGRVLAGCAGGALVFWGVRERKALGEFGVAVAEELQRALERNLREGFDAAKDAVDTAEEGLSETARAASKNADEGLDWAEAASSEVVEEYAQQRRRQPDVTEATH